jgi:predicted transcriptional regulator
VNLNILYLVFRGWHEFMSNNIEVKQRNFLDVIKVIWNNGSVTKSEIARSLNLTSITVHNYVSELIEKNLVIVDGNAESNGGRRAILYKFNTGFGYIVSQNLGISYLNTCIFDMGLNLLYRNKLIYPMGYSERIVNLMHKEIDTGIRILQLDYKKCIGIGISVPGQVDHESGVIFNLTNMPGWIGIPIKNIIEEKTGIATFVDNDNNVNVLSAKWLDIVKEQSNAVFISISSGIGTGILTKGKLLYGSHSNVGEIGHTTIQFDGPECTCGNRGCIEVLASDFAIIKKVKSCKKNNDAFMVLSYVS